jgi:hypothetical protein
MNCNEYSDSVPAMGAPNSMVLDHSACNHLPEIASARWVNEFTAVQS